MFGGVDLVSTKVREMSAIISRSRVQGMVLLIYGEMILFKSCNILFLSDNGDNRGHAKFAENDRNADLFSHLPRKDLIYHKHTG